MNNADQNTEVDISAAARERIDEFSRELALALKRIFSETQDEKDINLPDAFKANPLSKDKENSTK
ncbi:MAG: hypothetical protein H8D34_29290 [Chloroflexi bacterium]|nr:hypothetical protein [Chloroflexota bacterium]